MLQLCAVMNCEIYVYTLIPAEYKYLQATAIMPTLWM